MASLLTDNDLFLVYARLGPIFSDIMSMLVLAVNACWFAPKAGATFTERLLLPPNAKQP